MPASTANENKEKARKSFCNINLQTYSSKEAVFT